MRIFRLELNLIHLVFLCENRQLQMQLDIGRKHDILLAGKHEMYRVFSSRESQIIK